MKNKFKNRSFFNLFLRKKRVTFSMGKKVRTPHRSPFSCCPPLVVRLLLSASCCLLIVIHLPLSARRCLPEGVCHNVGHPKTGEWLEFLIKAFESGRVVVAAPLSDFGRGLHVPGAASSCRAALQTTAPRHRVEAESLVTLKQIVNLY
jgi:hypothetical protein